MSDYLHLANGPALYASVGCILLFVALFCLFFIVKSYRAGLKLGMKKEVLRRAITSSATFTVIPSISILLGVIALSGSLGVPISWLRLSVIGNLQYEATVATIAAENMGTALDSSVLTMSDLVTIMLVMTVGIIWGCLFSILFLKKYATALKRKPKVEDASPVKRKGFSSIAMVAMFIGLCATFSGSYIATAIVSHNLMPTLTMVISALSMGLFTFLVEKKGYTALESFSLALSMIVGMVGAVVLSL